MHIRENIPIKPYNTFGMNVHARWFTAVHSVEDLKEIFANPQWKDRHFILGGGSNILFTRDVDALVLHNEIRGISVTNETDDAIFVRTGAGEVWHKFVLDCIRHERAGTENLSLIPGSVGAGPMQNIGAYGVELKDFFHEVEAYHIREDYTRTFDSAACKFGYRESVFKNELKDQFFITSVTFRLNKKSKFNTSYGAIEKELERMGVQDLSIAAISQAVINIRTSKLPDPARIGNAGSFFKNPVVTAEEHKRLKKEFPELVAYPSGNDFKLAAGWLVEQTGWKGKRLGDAGVHKEQALVLVNYGNAKGSEIFELSEKVTEAVKDKFGVELVREVNVY